MNEETKSNLESANLPPPAASEAPMISPELIRRVASMLSTGGGADAPPSSSGTASAASAERSDGNDALSSLLSDPALLQRLPQILAVMKPLLNSAPLSHDAQKASPPKKGAPDNHRDRLLLSLKPFLSPSRCQAIDTMLRIAQLGELFGQIK